MLSEEGNKNGQKNYNRSYQEKSNFACAAHFFCTFLCCFFARLQRETSRNFLVTRFIKEMSYVFLFTFFFTVSHFHPGGRQYFSFCHRRLQNFHVVPPTKNVSFVFFSHWLACCPTFSFSLSVSCSIFQISGHDN